MSRWGGRFVPLAALAAVGLLGCTSPRLVVPPSSSAAAARPAASAVDGTQLALARRLCDALHTLPAQRKRECCPSVAAESLAGVCTGELEAALRRGTVRLDAGAVAACEAAITREL